MDLYSNIIENKNFSWNINFNLTHFKNKVLELSPELNGQLIDGGRIYREDESMYQLYLPKYVGVDSETGESLWALVTPDEPIPDGLADTDNEPVVQLPYSVV